MCGLKGLLLAFGSVLQSLEPDASGLRACLRPGPRPGLKHTTAAALWASGFLIWDRSCLPPRDLCELDVSPRGDVDPWEAVIRFCGALRHPHLVSTGANGPHLWVVSSPSREECGRSWRHTQHTLREALVTGPIGIPQIRYSVRLRSVFGQGSLPGRINIGLSRHLRTRGAVHRGLLPHGQLAPAGHREDGIPRPGTRSPSRRAPSSLPQILSGRSADLWACCDAPGVTCFGALSL